MATPADPLSAARGMSRKKFATPPVKSACLGCRAARSRCDGSNPCATCRSKDRECIYTQSRRGGPRPRKKHRTAEPCNQQTGLKTQSGSQNTFPTIPVQNYIDPGAGLRSLEDWAYDSDLIFDTLFDSSSGIGVEGSLHATPESSNGMAGVPMVRTYKSDAELLDAYYIFIHPFFPILPPPTAIAIDQPTSRLQSPNAFPTQFQPASPVGLAILAILSLIPHPDDTDHQDPHSLVFRRNMAQCFAQTAFETIENDDELLDSAIEPHKALSDDHERPTRPPFHPSVPVELEGIIALDILSVYEYAQRGNLKKMQSRAGSAISRAMDLSLHQCGAGEQSEVKRRVWWMTYICAAQGAIVNNSSSTLAMTSDSYTTVFPTISADPQAFDAFVQAQRAIFSATQFVIDLNRAFTNKSDLTPVYQRMRDLEASLEPLLHQTSSWQLLSSITSPVDSEEAVVARSLRCMAGIKLNSARIKLHRYCAFFDIPVFSRKHCDLKALKESDADVEPRKWPTCSCSSFTNPFSIPSSPRTNSTERSPMPENQAAPDTPESIPNPESNEPGTSHLPFNSHHSAKICLRSALNIAQYFDELPYPNPIGVIQSQGLPGFLSPTSGIICPRTMPSYACCAMQCAYALLMIYQRTESVYPLSVAEWNMELPSSWRSESAMEVGDDLRSASTRNLLVRLHRGLTSISATLANYATAFEALGGMRDQIRGAIEDSFVPAA